MKFILYLKMSSFLTNKEDNYISQDYFDYPINTNHRIRNRIYPYNELELKKVYYSNLNRIVELKNKLKNYDCKLNEIAQLNIKINHIKKLIQNKDRIILEYEKLNNLAKQKLIYFFNKKQFIKDDDNVKLEKENELLINILLDLKEQNKYYKGQINFQSNHNS